VHAVDEQKAVFRSRSVGVFLDLLGVGRLGYFADSLVNTFAPLATEGWTVVLVRGRCG